MGKKLGTKIIHSLDKSDEDIKMSFGKSCVTFQCGGITIFSQLVDGRFPEWRKHIPDKREEACAVVDSAELLSAIKRAMTILRRDNSRFYAFSSAYNGRILLFLIGIKLHS